MDTDTAIVLAILVAFLLALIAFTIRITDRHDQRVQWEKASTEEKKFIAWARGKSVSEMQHYLYGNPYNEETEEAKQRAAEQLAIMAILGNLRPPRGK